MSSSFSSMDWWCLTSSLQGVEEWARAGDCAMQNTQGNATGYAVGRPLAKTRYPDARDRAPGAYCGPTDQMSIRSSRRAP